MFFQFRPLRSHIPRFILFSPTSQMQRILRNHYHQQANQPSKRTRSPQEKKQNKTKETTQLSPTQARLSLSPNPFEPYLVNHLHYWLQPLLCYTPLHKSCNLPRPYWIPRQRPITHLLINIQRPSPLGSAR